MSLQRFVKTHTHLLGGSFELKTLHVHSPTHHPPSTCATLNPFPVARSREGKHTGKRLGRHPTDRRLEVYPATDAAAPKCLLPLLLRSVSMSRNILLLTGGRQPGRQTGTADKVEWMRINRNLMTNSGHINDPLQWFRNNIPETLIKLRSIGA